MPPYSRPNHYARDHDASLLVVCDIFWRKNKSMGRVTDKLAELIRKHVFKDFSLKNTYHPRVICDGCRKTLSDTEKVRVLKNHLFVCFVWSLTLFLFSSFLTAWGVIKETPSTCTSLWIFETSSTYNKIIWGLTFKMLLWDLWNC